MALGGAEIPHECAGTKSSQIDNNGFYCKKKKEISICVKVDNMVALSYLMKMGST